MAEESYVFPLAQPHLTEYVFLPEMRREGSPCFPVRRLFSLSSPAVKSERKGG